jgi:hypothetical protein
VNEELRHRNAELARVNNDLANLLSGGNIPIVMVSRKLRIRRFTPLAEKAFNLILSDIGRPISDMKPNLRPDDFAASSSRRWSEGERRDLSPTWLGVVVRASSLHGRAWRGAERPDTRAVASAAHSHSGRHPTRCR